MPKVKFLEYVISTDRVVWTQKKSQLSQYGLSTTVKQLQRFICYIYHFFNPAAEEVFTCHKDAFRATPILKHPDHSKHFEVGIDASDVSVGAILSQRFGKKKKKRKKASPRGLFLRLTESNEM